MIRHTVVFTLLFENDSPEEDDFFAAVAKLAAIPGVRNFEILRQIGTKNQFDYGLSMEFESMQAYEGYTQHPEHTRFVQDTWLSAVENFMELDFKEFRL